MGGSSPFQFKQPVRRIEGLKRPSGIPIGINEEVMVAEWNGNQVSVFDKQGRKLQMIQHKDLPQWWLILMELSMFVTGVEVWSSSVEMVSH